MSSTQGETIAVTVSLVAAAGEVATVSILRPDGVTDSVLVTLDASGAGSSVYQATIDGIFAATATIGADAKYSNASTASAVSFTVSSILLPRTISITVTPSP